MASTKSREELKQEVELLALKAALSSNVIVYKGDSANLKEAGDAYITALEKAMTSYNNVDLHIEVIRDKGVTIEIENVERPIPLDLTAYQQTLSELSGDEVKDYGDSVTNDEDGEEEEGDEVSSNEAVTTRRRGTVLKLVLDILRKANTPLTTAEVIEMVIKQLGSSIPVSTITNNLTRLSKAGIVLRTPIPEHGTSNYQIKDQVNEGSSHNSHNAHEKRSTEYGDFFDSIIETKDESEVEDNTEWPF